MLVRALKRAIALLLLGLLIAGCASLPGRARPPAPEKPLTLGLVTGYQIPFAGLIEDYNRDHPSMQVQIRWVRPFDADGKLDLAALEGIDLLYGQEGLAGRLAERGLLQDLQMPDADWDPKLRSLIEAKGRLTGGQVWLPLLLEPQMLRVQGPDLVRVGIPLPGYDWTWTDFEQIMQALADAGHLGHSIRTWDVQPEVIRSFGGGEYDRGTGRWHFNTAENRQAYEYLRGLVAKGLITPYSDSWVPPMSPITLAHGHISRRLGEQLMPMPVGPAGRFTRVHAAGLVLLRQSAQHDAVAAFVRYLLQPASQQAMAGSGVRPLVPDEGAMERWRQVVGDENAALIELGLETWLGDESPKAGEPWLRAVDRMMKGEAPIEETLAALDRQFSNR